MTLLRLKKPRAVTPELSATRAMSLGGLAIGDGLGDTTGAVEELTVAGTYLGCKQRLVAAPATIGGVDIVSAVEVIGVVATTQCIIAGFAEQ